MDDDIGDHMGFVVSSKYRMTTLRHLTENGGADIPSRIARGADIHQSHVSRALSRLRDRGLVELAVDESRRKGRIYAITEGGEDVWSEISDRGMD